MLDWAIILAMNNLWILMYLLQRDLTLATYCELYFIGPAWKSAPPQCVKSVYVFLHSHIYYSFN